MSRTNQNTGVHAGPIRKSHTVTKALGGLLVGMLMATSGTSNAHDKSEIALPLHKGALADYGATPWFTEALQPGALSLKFALDTGSNFIWATSDVCSTPACKAHDRFDTSQSGFKWLDKTRTKRSFGPWGDMYTYTGQIQVHQSGSTSNIALMSFFASVDYEGAKFQYLSWDGGIGFPSRSDQVSSGSSFLFHELWVSKYLNHAKFAMLTDRQTGLGVTILGDGIPDFLADADSAISLEPMEADLKYLWGTKLHSFSVGTHDISPLSGATFFLDSGSSRYKGDSKYVTRILETLYSATDSSGHPIFKKIMDGSQWVGLSYGKGGPANYPDLPYISFSVGQSCQKDDSSAAMITLSPGQYSYKVEAGERAGTWVVAARVLPGVGGLLVGSTVMDLFATEFNYESDSSGNLTQGKMFLYSKNFGERPAELTCIHQSE